MVADPSIGIPMVWKTELEWSERLPTLISLLVILILTGLELQDIVEVTAQVDSGRTLEYLPTSFALMLWQSDYAATCWKRRNAAE